MTEREKDAAFKEGYWTGRLDGLLNRYSGHAAMWVRLEAAERAIAPATMASLGARVTKENRSIG